MRVALLSAVPPIVAVQIAGEAREAEVSGLLDTGATSMVISTKLARHLGYDLAGASTTRVVTVNGAIEVPQVVLQSVAIEAAVARQVTAACHDLTGTGVSVLVGLSFLRHFVVTLDFKRGFLTLASE